MARWSGFAAGLWLALALPALAGADSAPAPAAAVAPPPARATATLDEVLALPSPLRAAWQAALARRSPARNRIERLVAFVFEPDGLGMRYREDANHDVATSYATREANCLGFTLLFLALARDAGLHAGAQEYPQTLSWRQADDTVYRTSHVNAWVRFGARRYLFDVRPDAFVARQRPRPLDATGLLAHWYNNRAIEQLGHGDAGRAGTLVDAALRLDPQRASHWSNAGVVRLRQGDLDGAERAYDQALALEPEHLDALFNRLNLALRRGDAAGAAQWRLRLERAQNADPFHQFLLALELERSGDLLGAIARFRRAIRLHGGEARFHAALARAYERAGEFEQAARAQRRARSLAAAAARPAGG